MGPRPRVFPKSHSENPDMFSRVPTVTTDCLTRHVSEYPTGDLGTSLGSRVLQGGEGQVKREGCVSVRQRGPECTPTTLYVPGPP